MKLKKVKKEEPLVKGALNKLEARCSFCGTVVSKEKKCVHVEAVNDEVALFVNMEYVA